MLTFALSGIIKGRSLGVWAQIGVMCIPDRRGWEGEPPAEAEYAVEPSAEATISPSQTSFSTMLTLSISILRLAATPPILAT